MKTFYLAAMLLGTLIPWFFFTSFFMQHSFDLSLFITQLFGDNAAAGFSSDVLISIVVFLIWSYRDAKRFHVRLWWMVLLACCSVGLSLALPLYLYLRETNYPSNDFSSSISDCS